MYKVVSYSAPVHRLDADGTWQDINNNLYLQEANGSVQYATNDGRVQFAEVSTGRYLLLITADATWINAEERVFPVTVDPTVIDKKIVVDIYTDSTRPNTNLDYENLLLISDTCTTYIRIKLPTLPDGAFCNSAIFHVEYYFATTTGSVTVGTYQALENWSSVDVTYNNSPPVDTTLLDSLVMTAGAGITASTPAVAEFDVSPAVKAWYAAGIDDVSGFAFKKLSGNTSTVYLKSYELNRARSYYEVDYSYTIPYGVYALRNQHMATSWMNMADYKPIAGIKLQHAVFQSSPTDQSLASITNRTSLFKISQKGTTGRYVIRSMVNNCLGFGYSNGNIVTVDIPADDESVDDANTFRIEWDGHGFTISPYNSAMVMTLTADSTDIEVIDKVTTVSRYQWDLIQYTGTHQSGIITTVSSATWLSLGITVGTESIIKVVGWSTLNDANWVYMRAIEGENAIQSRWRGYSTILDSASINNFIFTPILPGEIVLEASIGRNDAQTQIVFVREKSYKIIPKEGDYYIQNLGTKNYIDIEGPSRADGAFIQEWEFHTGSQALWTVEHAGDGAVRFKSKYSGLYLGVDPNNPTVVKQFDDLNNSTLWTFEVSEFDVSHFICKATPAYALCVASTEGWSGTNLSQTTSCSGYDGWTLYECNYTLNTIQYYDHGFETFMMRYNVNPATAIANYQAVVSERMMHIFGVRVVYNGVTQCTTLADECALNPDGTYGTLEEGQTCSHSPNHSLDKYSCTQGLLDGASDTTTVIVWTGHRLGDARSWSNWGNHSITMIPHEYNETQTITDVNEAYYGVLMHEISHQFEVRDHYCEKDGPPPSKTPCTNPTCDPCKNNRSERICLMTRSQWFITLSDEFLYCGDCKENIKNHLADHH